MLIRGFEKKLRKLEAKFRPPKGVFFLAWGCSEAEIEQVVTGAKDAGSVSRGDTLVRASGRVTTEHRPRAGSENTT